MKQFAILFLSIGLFAAVAPAQTAHAANAPAAVKQTAKPAATPTVPAAQPAQSAVKVTPKTPYDSTQGQLHASKMENLHFEFEQAKTKMAQDFQNRFEAEKKAYDTWAEGVCKANGWNCKEYQYDPSDDTWYHVLPAPAPAPAAPPTASK